MTHLELTRPFGLATKVPATGTTHMARRARILAVTILGLIALGGCVNVTAPDKPIVIELNVNIRQEVIYRLAADAESTIEENEDIF